MPGSAGVSDQFEELVADSLADTRAHQRGGARPCEKRQGNHEKCWARVVVIFGEEHPADEEERQDVERSDYKGGRLPHETTSRRLR